MTNTQPPGTGPAPSGARGDGAPLDPVPPGGTPGGEAARPGAQAVPGDPPARLGVVGRILAPLFPAAPEPAAASGGRRAAVLAVGIAAVLAGAAVLLIRQAGTPSWRTIWAEDSSIFVPRGLADPWVSLIRPYAGYEQLVPQLVADLVTRFPLRYTAAGLAIGGALITSASGLFVYQACAGHVRLRALRVLLGVSVVLLPTAVIEIANSAVDVQWYLMYVLFWVLVWRPRAGAGRAVAAVMAFATMATNILNLLYLPLVAARVIALRRGREQAATFGYLAGVAFQIPAVVTSHQLSRVGPLGPAVHFYGQHVLAAAVLGWRLALRLQGAIGVSACIALGGTLVAVVAGAAVAGRNRRVQVFTVAALGMGIILTVLPVLIRYWVGSRASSDLWVPGSRFSTSAILLIDAIAVVAVDALWHRLTGPGAAPAARPGAGGPPGTWRRVTAGLAVALLVAGLGLGWWTSFRYLNVRSSQTPWSQHYLHYARRIHATGQPAGTHGGH